MSGVYHLEITESEADLKTLLASQPMENWTQKFGNLPKHYFTAIFGSENDRVFVVSLRVRQALIKFRHYFVLLRIC